MSLWRRRQEYGLAILRDLVVALTFTSVFLWFFRGSITQPPYLSYSESFCLPSSYTDASHSSTDMALSLRKLPLGSFRVPTIPVEAYTYNYMFKGVLRHEVH